MKTKVVFGVVCMLFLSILAGAFGVTSSARASTAIAVRGAVSCANHQFVNIWVNSTGGGSGFYWFQDNADNRGGIFYATVNTNFPTTISLHVGCGGSTWNWGSDNWTPGFTLNSPQDNPSAWTTSCNEGYMVPHTAQRCSWGGSSAEKSALQWVKDKVGKGQEYSNECLRLVFEAYRNQGVAIDSYWTHQVSPDGYPYPVNVWPNITYGFKSDGSGFHTDRNVPVGALVFFLTPNTYPGSYAYSHIGISAGGELFYSSSDTYGDKNGYLHEVHPETITQHNQYSAGKYVGWWLPA